MTRFDEVRLTCRNTVKGNCKLSTICEMMSPLNGLPINRMSKMASPNDSTTPTMECGSLALYDSLNNPEKILPANSSRW